MVRKILNEYKWRQDRDFNLIEVHYIDRLSPRGYAILKGEDIEDMGDRFIFTKNGMIPYHRVIRILYDGKIIYEKTRGYHNKYSKKP
ncbi:DUF504 domain-containing protein [Candidatus Aciduliprofundum boonei]|uniref:MJ1316 RNA cyclic group end recognition domain-containing protein n=1 Tax=Aciduliprofundum boonei (strain DSM 19572 / T469) TaxID=439481 RepID=D3TA69_ACIB4|nr:RNA repair domain-containing protein [Candidatus Aciduliprofundum boonei]ADD08998.1 Protein of unknown function DUF504 [Aciduliprofundum boonei T469]HII55728.1 DUF504 domain-containing protein [Candidatus Aciduliprofundum boonei]